MLQSFASLLVGFILAALLSSPALSQESNKFYPPSARFWEQYMMPEFGVTNPIGDRCVCHLYVIPVVFTDLDSFVVRTTTADFSDHMEFAVFSINGAVRYFWNVANVTVPGIVSTPNSIESPSMMAPGSYWVCLALNNALPGTSLRTISRTNSALSSWIQYLQTCTGGIMPETLPSPPLTFTLITGMQFWWQLQRN